MENIVYTREINTCVKKDLPQGIFLSLLCLTRKAQEARPGSTECLRVACILRVHRYFHVLHESARYQRRHGLACIACCARIRSPTQTHANTRKPTKTHANARKHMQAHANTQTQHMQRRCQVNNNVKNRNIKMYKIINLYFIIP